MCSHQSRSSLSPSRFQTDKSEDAWKQTLLLSLASLDHALAEVTGTLNPALDALPKLPLCPLSTYGRITPAFALARLTTLLHLLRSLLSAPPPVVSFPLFSILAPLLRLLESFVPAGRRSEEASCNGIALSPREQWLLFPLVYPPTLDVLALLFQRLGSHTLVLSQRVATPLRLFFLRCYREYDVWITIQTLFCIRFSLGWRVIRRQLLLFGGASFAPLFAELQGPLLAILRAMNTAVDKVSITQSERLDFIARSFVEKGKKRQRKQPAIQIDQPSSSSSTQESFAWASHPASHRLYLEAARFLRVLLLRGRFLKEETVLAFHLELFIALSRSLAPSHSHRAKFPVSTFRELQTAVLDAALAAASVGFPRGFDA